MRKYDPIYIERCIYILWVLNPNPTASNCSGLLYHKSGCELQLSQPRDRDSESAIVDSGAILNSNKYIRNLHIDFIS
jgi:hypothetical protein